MGTGLCGALVGAALLAGCSESLLPGPDREAPHVAVLAPTKDALIDPQAPLRVEVRASDDQGVKSIALSVIGGNGQPIYTGEVIEFETDRPAPTSAELVRVLQPIANAPRPTEARVIATVMDFAERTSADTVVVAIKAEGDPGGNVEPVGAGVRFSVAAPARVELTDTLLVSVAANAKAGVREVGVTLFAILRGGSGSDTLSVQSQRVAASATTLRFPVEQLNLPRLQTLLAARDSVGLALEINAFAVDANGTCASASVPDSTQTLACRAGPGGATLAPTAGARQGMLVTRGRTVQLGATGDRLADLAWDAARGRLFASNHTRNALEVLNPGELRFDPASRIKVGSEPWGLALGRTGDTLFVANSGGTNISAVSLGALHETGRIQTPNIMLFDVTFSMDSVDVGGAKELHAVPSAAVWYDYSDRPQFIAQTASGELLFSTKPTAAAKDGTIRRLTLDTGAGALRTEVFVDYAIDRLVNKVGVINADSVFVTVEKPQRLYVFPRKGGCSVTSAPVVGFVEELPAVLAANGCDTRFVFGLDIAQVGLADTTFVAVSGDRKSVAFGEGARSVGRVMLFQDRGGNIVSATSNVRDLTLNAAERVSGLGMNSDGSLGVARGASGYFFNDDLRLQGVVSAGAPSGGVAMHPAQSGIDGLAFISGVDAASGVPFVDVVDVRNFARRRRIIIRDAVIGSLVAAMPTPADQGAGAALTLYGITANGVVKLNLSAADLPAS